MAAVRLACNNRRILLQAMSTICLRVSLCSRLSCQRHWWRGKQPTQTMKKKEGNASRACFGLCEQSVLIQLYKTYYVMRCESHFHLVPTLFISVTFPFHHWLGRVLMLMVLYQHLVSQPSVPKTPMYTDCDCVATQLFHPYHVCWTPSFHTSRKWSTPPAHLPRKRVRSVCMGL